MLLTPHTLSTHTRHSRNASAIYTHAQVYVESRRVEPRRSTQQLDCRQARCAARFTPCLSFPEGLATLPPTPRLCPAWVVCSVHSQLPCLRVHENSSVALLCHTHTHMAASLRKHLYTRNCCMAMATDAMLHLVAWPNIYPLPTLPCKLSKLCNVHQRGCTSMQNLRHGSHTLPPL